MSRIKSYQIILNLLILCLIASSQDIEYGLDFQYLQPDFPDRHSFLDLTKDEPINIPNNFSLTFDVKIHNKNHYGIVFSMYFKDSDNHILLIYKPINNSDSSKFITSQNFDNHISELKYDKKSLDTWTSFQLNLNNNTDSLKVTFKNTSKRAVIKPIKNGTNIKLFFGSSLYRTDPASMALRNIIIKDEDTGDILHNWPIKEFEGNTIRDNINGNTGYFYNSSLRQGSYYESQKIFGLKITHDVWFHRPTIDIENGIIYLTSKKNIYKILYNGSLLKIIKNNPPVVEYPEWNFPIYDNHNKQLIGVDRSHGQVSFYNSLKNKWSEIESEKTSGQYYNHSLFIDSSNGGLYLIGGYGYFTVKKDLLKYNYEEAKWDTVILSGAYDFYPRYNVIVTPADSTQNYFVFGGYGNISGQQDKDFRPLNDLWLLNLKQKSITKIDSINIPDNYVTGSGFYCKQDSSLYFGCYPAGHLAKRDSLKILHFKYNIKKKALKKLEFNNSLSENLFYLPSKSMGYSFKETKGKDYKVIELYRFKVPFKGQEIKIEETFNYRLIIILSLLGFSLVSVLVFQRFKKKIQKSKTKTISSNEISLFGNVAINSNVENLIENVSPQIKEMFIYFLIYTFVNNNKITTEKFTNDFWPDLDKFKAKNARSSATKRLRQFLTNIPDIELIKKGKVWRLEIHENIVFDFREYNTIRTTFLKLNKLQPDELEQLILIIDKGLPCEDLDYDWLNPIKLSIQKEIENMCFGLMNNNFDRSDLKTVEKLSSVLFKWDPLNEKNLSFLLNNLKQQNRITEVNSIYNQFLKEYFNLFNTEYTGKIETILNITKN